MDFRFSFGEKPREEIEFNAIKIMPASPEKIRSWSYGEVIKPETINYRTFKPERGGLFCTKIFGPTKDWECHCGKYKRMKHRGIVCEKCGVEVIESKVRRERMGHIELASPVSHIWFFKGIPSRIGHVLDMSVRELERVLYYQNYLVIDPGTTKKKVKDLLTEDEYLKLVEKHGDSFIAKMGAEAIKEVLAQIDPETLAEELREDMRKATSHQKAKKIVKRLKVVEAFRKSGARPEWMILDVIPVIPPELRPLVPLDGGRFAISDLNDLYRRVINRNNRLKRLQELNAPDVIIRNEKRMLQEAVDALFDNGRRGRVLKGTNNRPLRSLSDVLKGKQGRFRQNLLGKRVDYSGRSVIVAGPELKLYQCGLPKDMALELFKPFIFQKLEERGLVETIKSAKKKVDDRDEVIWEILEEVIKEHPVLLNRAPTLHRLGIQGFQPILVEGKAIRIHPLVCQAFNADFDGDQMAVHIPLSLEAQLEAKVLMMASNNLLSPASGQPIAIPNQDIVLGCYYLTLPKDKAKGEGKIFKDTDDVVIAYENGFVEIGTRIKVRVNAKLLETTVGRVLFNQIFPEDFEFFNDYATNKALRDIIGRFYRRYGKTRTVELLDTLKDLGYKYATKAGISICIDDMVIPKTKKDHISVAMEKVIAVESEHHNGVISLGERYNKIIDIWSSVTEQITEELFAQLESGSYTTSDGESKPGRFNPIYMMAHSGARGSKQQIRQLAGLRGLMAKPSGEIIETPITSNFREGLTVLQYFNSTHGARKGLADTALKTANSGYLTRRLVDVAQDVIITEYDCGTPEGITMEAIIEGGEIITPLKERLIGRISAEDVLNPKTKQVIVGKNQEIDEDIAQEIEDSNIKHVKIRSVMTCETRYGVCALCYGRNLATGNLVELGEAIGVIAAQSIGEPGTQLTMRTFHIGGAASKVIEQTTLDAEGDGVVKYQGIQWVTNKHGEKIVMNRHSSMIINYDDGREKEYMVVYGATLMVDDGGRVKQGDTVIKWDPFANVILTEKSGTVIYHDIEEGVTMKEEVDDISMRSTKVISDFFAENKHPVLMVLVEDKDRSGEVIHVSPDADVKVDRGTVVSPGDVIATEPLSEDELKRIKRPGKKPARKKPTTKEIKSPIDGIVRRVATKADVIQITIDEVKKYHMPYGAHLEVTDGEPVKAGDIIAKIPRETTKTKDITGGLPRVVELFEARRPKEAAIISEIDGIVHFAGFERGMRRIVVKNPQGVDREYLIPKGAHVSVYEGDFIRPGEPLMDGAINPHDILRIQGIKELQRYLVNEIQQVYRLQGVTINDKHIEIIVRQMLRLIKITDVGDTKFLLDQQVDKFEFQEENKRVKEQDGTPAKGEPLLLGITKAALSTDSFVSAASFQETTRILTDAATKGKVDMLRGLKENIVVGRLIPAGTGMGQYKNTVLTTKPIKFDIFRDTVRTEKEEERDIEAEIKEEVFNQEAVVEDEEQVEAAEKEEEETA